MSLGHFDGLPTKALLQKVEEARVERIPEWKAPTPIFQVPKGIPVADALDVVLGESDPESEHIVMGTSFSRKHSTYMVKGVAVYCWDWVPRHWAQKPYTEWYIAYGPKRCITPEFRKRMKSYRCTFKEDWYNDEVVSLYWGDSEKENLGMMQFLCDLASFTETTVPLKETSCFGETESFLFTYEFTP